jgi:hypothetical protein
MTETTTRADPPGASDTTENSTDASRRQPLALRAQKRVAELETLALELPAGDMLRSEIELALSSVSGLLTGNLDKLAETTSVGLDRWLESNKHLGQTTPHG